MTDPTRRIWQPQVTLATLQQRAMNTMVNHLGIELLELGDDFLAGSMPVDSRTCQPMRILHGGASVALAETLGSLAANSVVDLNRQVCMGQEINANHLRPVPEGHKVIGTARAIHLGARSQVWSIEIRNERKQMVCISRLTIAVLDR